jgi:hypothetical protein
VRTLRRNGNVIDDIILVGRGFRRAHRQ